MEIVSSTNTIKRKIEKNSTILKRAACILFNVDSGQMVQVDSFHILSQTVLKASNNRQTNDENGFIFVHKWVEVQGSHMVNDERTFMHLVLQIEKSFPNQNVVVAF